MYKIYKNNRKTKLLEEATRLSKGTWLNINNPTREEIEELSSKLKIDTEFLNYLLDEDEMPRTDTGKDKKLIVVDVPSIKTKKKHNIIKTKPLIIMLVRNEYILTIEKQESFLSRLMDENRLDIETNNATRFVIEILYKVAGEYLKYLKTINEEIEKCEELMFDSTKNKDLKKLLPIEKSLIYIMTSLHANKAVLEKMLKSTNFEMEEEDKALLEDAMIENDQAIEIAHLYREILSSTTDSFATIISNNLNGVMKFLAGITIVISIPTMVASFFGMNVPLGRFTDNPYSFMVLLLISIFASIAVAIILKKKNML